MATPTETQSASSTAQAISASCTTAVPGRHGYVPPDSCDAYYNYDPQFAPAVAVAVIFGLLTVAHLAQAISYKKRFCWVIVMGALWECGAKIFGAIGALDQRKASYALVSQLAFLLAPLWINAGVYMSFARLVQYWIPDKKVGFIKAASMAKYFVLLDIVSFIIQGVGGVMASPGAGGDVIKIGIDVYMAGMGLQEAFILFFIGLMIVFHRKALELESQGFRRERGWRGLLYALYGALTAITVRIIYRIIEYGRGVTPSNPIPYHEAYSYALDAFPMMIAILLLNIFHPGRYLVGPDSEFTHLSRKEKKQLKREKKEEKLRMKEEKKARKNGERGEMTEFVPLEDSASEEYGHQDHHGSLQDDQDHSYHHGYGYNGRNRGDYVPV